MKIQSDWMSKRQSLLIFLIMSSLVCLSACQTGPSKSSSKDPYAANAPKTKEEEAYYQDVYSGEWREQSNPFGMGKSICKKNGGTSMPQHWAMMPHGAKTMTEIRSEIDSRRAAQMNQQLVAQSAPQVAMNGPMPQNRYESPMPATYNAPVMNAGQQPSAPIAYSAPTPYVAANNSAPLSHSTVNHASMNNQNQSYSSMNNPAQGNVTSNSQATNSSLPNASGSYTVTPGFASVSQVPNHNMSSGNVPNSGMKGNINGQNQIPSQNQGSPAANSAPFPQVPGFTGAMNSNNAMIIRGQMPEQNENEKTAASMSLRKRMRNAYFTVEPVKVAQADGNVPGDKVLGGNDQTQNVGTDDSKQLPLKVNANIATPWKTLPPNTPLPHKTGVNRRQQELRSYEYIFDGGDRKGEYYSTPDWHHYNLDVEDSITQFDTEDGQIMAEPSNRVQIYSPRFGSVRQVLGPVQKTEVGAIANTETDTPSLLAQGIAATDVRTQDAKASFTRADRMASSASAKTRSDSVSDELAPAEKNQYDWVGHLDSIMVSDSIQDSDRLALMSGSTAAEAWGSIQQVNVDIDSVRAQVNIYNKSAEALVTVINGTKTSKLRMFKVANKQSAQPGELVEFTLRYENVGNTTVGNVTVMDNLAARLEYIDGSAQSSRKGEFFVRSNLAGSQVLRWEITDPLKKGEFGVVKFICKVR